jgi:hypothetical protein
LRSSRMYNEKETAPPKEDGRKGCRGSSHRHQYSAEEKVNHLEALEMWQDEQKKQKKKGNCPVLLCIYVPKRARQMEHKLIKVGQGRCKEENL